MARADSKLIHWLLHESNITRYQISMDTDVSESTLGRITHGKTPLSKVYFGNAHKLSEYARIQKEIQDKAKRGVSSNE